MIKYLIEEEWHAGIEGEYDTYEEAINELKRRADIPWDKTPNTCPCISWKTCSKLYIIAKYDAKNTPYDLISKEEILEIGSKGVDWKIETK